MTWKQYSRSEHELNIANIVIVSVYQKAPNEVRVSAKAICTSKEAVCTSLDEAKKVGEHFVLDLFNELATKIVRTL